MSGRTITIVASEILGRPGTGGAGTADSLLAVALARQGHRVELATHVPSAGCGGYARRRRLPPPEGSFTPAVVRVTEVLGERVFLWSVHLEHAAVGRLEEKAR